MNLKNNNMQTIKHFKNNPKKLLVNGVLYKGYGICDIPPTFGFIYNATKEQEGISEWFNYKGLTWLIDNKS